MGVIVGTGVSTDIAVITKNTFQMSGKNVFRVNLVNTSTLETVSISISLSDTAVVVAFLVKNRR